VPVPSADSQAVGSPVTRRTRSRRARCPSGVGNCFGSPRGARIRGC